MEGVYLSAVTAEMISSPLPSVYFRKFLVQLLLGEISIVSVF